ncbi:propionyl-CoA synthetase [Actinomadura decatromicini]|uniref:Propionyl-CoA synthetase n=1 Tax=Actinomadura decatromicini TaxID=2604572 RepID=A0A5D3FWZ4_9ACTN|nr:propionyl-CoA synthetase [Actinomadura decatromicini]
MVRSGGHHPSAGPLNAHTEWLDDPEAFWERQAARLVWEKPWETTLDASSAPLYRWFPDGTINAAENCLDVHLAEGRGDAPALIFDSPRTGAKDVYTYRRLHREVVAFAAALDSLRPNAGDTVLIFMPAIARTVVAMLACARLGLTHSVVIPSVPATVLRDRIDDARPAIVLTASGGFDGPDAVEYQPLLEAALTGAAHQPRHIVVLQRPEAGRWTLAAGRDLDWSGLVADSGTAGSRLVHVPSTHPLYLLYTSGSTARPKAVTRDTGGYLTALRWAVENVFGVGPGDVFWTDSHPGWVMGHSFTVYGALVSGATTVVHEGSPVDTSGSSAFPRIISEYGVDVLFTTPMTLRRLRRASHRDRPLGVDGSPLRAVFLASERVEPDLLAWTGEFFGCPVVDNWWQTETGWPIASNCLGPGLLPVKPGSVSRPLPGYRIEVLDDDGRPLPAGEQGHLAIKLPLPPGCLTTLWNDDQRFIDTYLTKFPGYYDTSDAGHIDEDGYLWIAGRTDDIINVGGDSLSGIDLEHVLGHHPAVERCAVVAAPDPLYTQVPVAFVVPRDQNLDPANLARELRGLVDERIGEWARLHRLLLVRTLTYTTSKKIKRSDLRAWLSTGTGLDIIADIHLPAHAP